MTKLTATKVHGRIGVDLAGMKMRSPCIIGSSFLTGDIRRIKRADAAGAGAISVKAAFLEVPYDFRADILVHKKGLWITSPGDKRISVEYARQLIGQAKEETDLTVIANMIGPGVDLQGWQNLARLLESAGADALELGISCPNFGAEIYGIPAESAGGCIAQYPDLAVKVTKAVREAVKIPIVCKLSGAVSSISQIARSCHEGGADAVTAINGLPARPPIDIYRRGRSLYMGMEGHSQGGGVCGPAIFPVACRSVSDIATTVPIPVIGCGGVSSWEDAVQMIMWGASAIEVCTAVILHGFRVIERINEGLEQFMVQEGYNSIDEFRGLALQYLTPPAELHFNDVRLHIDMDKCNLCGLCTNIGQCLAISMSENSITLNNSECIMCGVCAQICPRQAIRVEGGRQPTVDPAKYRATK